jgi:hypothetical protein
MKGFDTLIAPLSKLDPNMTQIRTKKIFPAKTLKEVDQQDLKSSLSAERSRKNFYLEP